MMKDLISVVRKTKYSLDAFLFVQRGLDFAVRRTYGEPNPDVPPESRHITGQQLCLALRDFAVKEYGLLARIVLRRWNITASEDFGHIVFTMVEAHLMQKSEEDTLSDFMSVFDFAAAFGAPLQLPQHA